MSLMQASSELGRIRSLAAATDGIGALRVRRGLVQQDTFTESGFSAKYAELHSCSAIFRGKLQSFSAIETCWRRTQS